MAKWMVRTKDGSHNTYRHSVEADTYRFRDERYTFIKNGFTEVADFPLHSVLSIVKQEEQENADHD